MSNLFIISILYLNFQIIFGNYLDIEPNYDKPKLLTDDAKLRKSKIERNIVNKGVWVRNKQKDNIFEKSSFDFIFRPNSLDIDNVLLGESGAFGETGNSPFITSYVERVKRGADAVVLPLLKNAKNGANYVEADKASSAKSKIITKLKPASVFNDYPYEVAILLANNKKMEEKFTTKNIKFNKNEKNNSADIDVKNTNKTTKDNIKRFNETNKYKYSNATTPKRSMNNAYETEVIKKIEITKNFDSINNQNKVRGVFDKEDTWQQTAPLPNAVYKVIPKEETRRNKPITERGLVKILSMLTKTFKKIMRQHNDIKEMHNNMHILNSDFLKNVAFISEKFQDFYIKYDYIFQVNEKLKNLDLKLNTKEEYFRKKEKDLAENLMEFENQQKKFLAQQKQFYNIQKLMLTQNEKINVKQNLIAMTQAEISHRQNHFARILKKAKQIYIGNNSQLTKTLHTIKLGNKTDQSHFERTIATTPAPQASESVKINLFSIPTKDNRIENQDQLLLNGKDSQAVDDLVYKYYFNNTFIDNIMKSRFFNNYVQTDTNEVRTGKNKRNKSVLFEKTILLPVNRTNGELINYISSEVMDKTIKRKKRWIHHKKTHHRRNRDKIDDETEMSDDKARGGNLKPRSRNAIENHKKSAKIEMEMKEAKHGFDMLNKPHVEINNVKTDTKRINKVMEGNSKGHTNVKNTFDVRANPLEEKASPFMAMAKNFCNQIGQNMNEQILNWCIEKSLRKLQNIDLKLPVPPVKLSPPTAPVNVKNRLRPQRLGNDSKIMNGTQLNVVDVTLNGSTGVNPNNITYNNTNGNASFTPIPGYFSTAEAPRQNTSTVLNFFPGIKKRNTKFVHEKTHFQKRKHTLKQLRSKRQISDKKKIKYTTHKKHVNVIMNSDRTKNFVRAKPINVKMQNKTQNFQKRKHINVKIQNRTINFEKKHVRGKGLTIG